MSLLRIIAIILGIVIAAIGGVVAYRAWFLEPSSAVIITETQIRQVPDTFRVVSGILLLALGTVIAFLAARKRQV